MTSQRSKSRWRPNLEPMEDRCLMTAVVDRFTVVDHSDSVISFYTGWSATHEDLVAHTLGPGQSLTIFDPTPYLIEAEFPRVIFDSSTEPGDQTYVKYIGI